MPTKKIQLQFLIVVLVITLFLAFNIFKPFIAPLALAIVFAVVLQPVYRKLTIWFGNRPSLASFATVTLSILCLFIPSVILGTQVLKEARGLYDSLSAGSSASGALSTIVTNIGATIQPFIPGTDQVAASISADIDVYMRQALSWIVDHLGTAVTGVSTVVVDLFIFVISLYYLLRDGRKLKQAIVALSPLEDSADERIFHKLASAVNSVIAGNLIIALVQGIMTAVGLAIFGVPNAFLWGTIAAIAALVPGFGTLLVLAPSVLYLFLIGHVGAGIGLALWGALAVGLIDNLLGPKVMGRGMQLHPLFILLSVLGGIAFLGPTGVFLGPLVFNLLFACIEIYTYLSHELTSHRSML